MTTTRADKIADAILRCNRATERARRVAVALEAELARTREVLEDLLTDSGLCDRRDTCACSTARAWRLLRAALHGGEQP